MKNVLTTVALLIGMAGMTQTIPSDKVTHFAAGGFITSTTYIGLNRFELKESNRDIIFTGDLKDELMSEMGVLLGYIGAVIIKRDIWFENSREQFFGSWFVHVGVIFSSKLIKNSIFISKPLIEHRSGNASWTFKSFDIWYSKWPNLIWSFDQYSEAAKHKVTSRTPWTRNLSLLKSRAMGEYNHQMYTKYIASNTQFSSLIIPFIISYLPRLLLNTFILIYCAILRRHVLYTLYNIMLSSPAPRVSNFILKVLGIRLPLY